MADNANNTLQTIDVDRIKLRKIEYFDSREIFDIFSSEETMKYYGMFPFTKVEETLKLIEHFSNSIVENTSLRWGIELKSKNKLIGTCGFHSWNKKHRRAEIGYELNKDYKHKGYMSEALGEIIKYGFDHMELNRIEALIYPENTASKSLIKKLGFVEEGILEEYCIFLGKGQDLVMYSLSKKRYEENKNQTK